MNEIIIPSIVVTVILATIPGAVAFLIAWGKINERMRQIADDVNDQCDRTERTADQVNQMQREHDVMRAEIVHMAARLAVGDRRLDEVTALSRGMAVMENELKGIRGELVSIRGELQSARTGGNHDRV